MEFETRIARRAARCDSCKASHPPCSKCQQTHNRQITRRETDPYLYVGIASLNLRAGREPLTRPALSYGASWPPWAFRTAQALQSRTKAVSAKLLSRLNSRPQAVRDFSGFVKVGWPPLNFRMPSGLWPCTRCYFRDSQNRSRAQ